jgi:hypothetical protein
MNQNKDHKADKGGTGERGGQREENRRDNPQPLHPPKEDRSNVRELPIQQKEDARRRQESGGRKG